MLDDRAETLVPGSVLGKEPYTLIFGNEATGLPADYAEIAKPLIIPQSESVDSLNLTIAAGIGMYMFKNTFIFVYFANLQIFSNVKKFKIYMFMNLFNNYLSLSVIILKLIE